MSSIKRSIEDKCEEIANRMEMSYDEILDIFNMVNSGEYISLEGMNDNDIWAFIEKEANELKFSKELSFGKGAPIRTGYIPVEYNYYKTLVEKAKKHDELTKEKSSQPVAGNDVFFLDKNIKIHEDRYGQLWIYFPSMIEQHRFYHAINAAFHTDYKLRLTKIKEMLGITAHFSELSFGWTVNDLPNIKLADEENEAGLWPIVFPEVRRI